MTQPCNSKLSGITSPKSLIAFFLIACVSGSVSISPAQTEANGMLQVSRGLLCVTEGEITETPEKTLSIDVPKLRAYVNAWTAPDVEARFTYLGPTAQDSRLGSGEMRRQFGLKLHAQDACNLVYAIWRIEPESKLVVSVKSNPGQSTSSMCGNRGYRNIKPGRSSPIPVLSQGATHTLRAVVNDEDVSVFIDGASVWEGTVGADAARLQGPIGIRSDNARLEIQLKAGKSREIHPDYVVACKKGPGEPE